MGRKKGRQAGEFPSKSQNAAHRHTVYVDHASEANGYRNPVQRHGYRSSSTDIIHGINGPRGVGYWHSNGNSYGGGDKWSSIFSSSRSSHARAAADSRSVNRVNMGLSHLRRLLQERRSEDRLHERQHRLRLQRSRIVDGAGHMLTTEKSSSIAVDNSREKRHEPGWMLSQEISAGNIGKEEVDHTMQSGFPSLQTLAARALGPLLPMYCAACGSDFVGDSLKSVSANIISALALSLATSTCSDPPVNVDGNHENNPENALYATTDGVVKALVNSGVATELVLRGAPVSSVQAFAKNEEGEEDEDTRLFSDDGLLSLCPRILAADCDRNSTYPFKDDESSDDDDWEDVDFDIGLNSRLAGCFHLTRLELIDVPLQTRNMGGVSIEALRAVLRSCSGITHLSLSGCFFNWEEANSSLITSTAESVTTLLCGTQNLASQVETIRILGDIHGNRDRAKHLIQQLLFHQVFEEDVDKKDEVSGLEEMLPDLMVLDISDCTWATPRMIVQFLLKLWERSLHLACATEVVDDSMNESHRQQLDNGADSAVRTGIPLKHLNIRGCTGLLTESLSLPTWMEEWRVQGLFDGVDVSTKRQSRM